MIVFMIMASLALEVVDGLHVQNFCTRSSVKSHFALNGKITPNKDESMDEYRRAVIRAANANKLDENKLGGRELLDLIIRKWYCCEGGVLFSILKTLTPYFVFLGG